MLGLPITISNNPKIYKDLDTPYNKKAIKPYMKFIKKFIKDNREELEEYWDINPESKNGLNRLIEIENMIRSRYE